MLKEFSKRPNNNTQSLKEAILAHTCGNAAAPDGLPGGFAHAPELWRRSCYRRRGLRDNPQGLFQYIGVLLERFNLDDSETPKVLFDCCQDNDRPVHFKVDTEQHDINHLVKELSGTPLTLEGELNKLAANISIGRNMAGVHYFSDYYDSLRLGEEIAIGILEEQALTYPKDAFNLSLVTFDGKRRTF